MACWILLPLRLQRSALGPSSDACLTLADDTPGGHLSRLPLLEHCAVLLPDDVELLADLGAMYEAAGRPMDAEAVYLRALARDPDYADLHARVARLLVARDAIGNARAHAEAALQLQPNRQAVQDLLNGLTLLTAEGR